MNTHKSHCSTLGRTVDIAIADQGADESGASAAIAAIVCLDRSPLCTGATCPLTGATPAVMTLRLARSGLSSTAEAGVARCPACGHITTPDLAVGLQAVCNKCDTARAAPE